MVVTVTVVRVMQVPVDQVIHMVAVGHGFVSATRTVNMASLVTEQA